VQSDSNQSDAKVNSNSVTDPHEPRAVYVEERRIEVLNFALESILSPVGRQRRHLTVRDIKELSA
jgi:hypothetical protein